MPFPGLDEAVASARYCLYVATFENRCQGATEDGRLDRTTNLLPRLNCWICMESHKSLVLNTQVLKNIRETHIFSGLGAHPANHVQMADQEST